MRELARLLEARARDGGEALVVPSTGQRMSWPELMGAVLRREAALRRAGVAPGERVGLLLPRSPSFLEHLFALWRLDAVAVPLDVASPAGELRGFADHCGIDRVVLDLDETPQDPDAFPAEVGLVDAREGLPLRPPTGPREPSPGGDALILYTSGSTGRPKGVRHTHDSIAASVDNLRRRYFASEPPRILGVLPLHHSHGIFVHGLSGLAHGGALIMAPPLDLFSAVRTWDLARRERADFFSAVPSHYRLLLHASEGRAPAGLRAFSASAPLPEDLARALERDLGLAVANNFGMTEAAGWCLYSDPGDPPGSIGRPGGVRIRLEEGELLLAGDQVTPGYWREPELTAEALADGWLRTGDRVEQEASGRLLYRGRLKRTLQVAGVSVYPEDIEAALRRLPDVVDCAVVGVADPVYGEQPRAFVALRPGSPLGPAELDHELRENLASYRCPHWIELVERIPVTSRGKPDLAALAARPLGAP